MIFNFSLLLIVILVLLSTPKDPTYLGCINKGNKYNRINNSNNAKNMIFIVIFEKLM